MIEALLPPQVVTVHAYDDRPDEAPYPGEEDLVARAVESRRREFVTARRCAREALGRLGHPAAPIRSGPRREPVWPAGVVGSITHCAGYRAAAVARRTELAGLGIDAEPHEALPDGVAGTVTVAGEPGLLARLDRDHPAVHWGRVLFSAKESVYKAWYPLTGRWLGFEDAELSLEPGGGFGARVLVDGTRGDGGPPLTELRGRWLVDRGLIVTAVSVPH
ncbi:4'-phosphopantetheinyl transferase family protein [Micromonospora auratinigra]|uniref:4'-phosphopantetheinyl transferase EntD (Siderophore biosynthesis) n=1 Tax=Micromonospora auratinigra TaxID=261654 RepID=A0A1A8Z0U6_9ACTN|nr:4'-phosphopantetheinyl transferase superfamily protein [Micromonospora auratinigra]SBT37420.1 4'-phosphopantetheinyl transferase EntD (siderophore biosynthesis) [Micromonospora auratinigra]